MAMDEMSKKMTEDLTGKPYEPGDLGIELDKRVKSSVASFAGKDEYEPGDLTRYDSLFLDFTLSLCLFRRLHTSFPPCLSFIRLSSRATRTAISCALFSACFSPHAPLRPIDLNRTIAARVMNRVEEFTGKPYEFGDISRKVEEHRKQWVKGFLGEEAASNYQFGDITKTALAKFTGKEEYKFGDVSKKIFGDVFGKRKRGGGD